MLDVITQFFHDSTIGAGEKNEQFDSSIADRVKKLCSLHDKYSDWKPGMIVVSCDIASGGGHIDFYEINSLKEKDSGIEHRVYGDFSAYCSVLIEPLGYPEIEPYNRQSPYYIGCSYGDLTKYATESFNVYVAKDGFRKANLFTSFDEFYWNDYWKNIRFGVVLNKEDVADFIKLLFMLLGSRFGEVGDVVSLGMVEAAKNYKDESA